MKVKIDQSFEKDLEKLKDGGLNKQVAKVIQQVQEVSTLKESPNLKTER